MTNFPSCARLAPARTWSASGPRQGNCSHHSGSQRYRRTFFHACVQRTSGTDLEEGFNDQGTHTARAKEIVELLLAYGADPSIRNNEGMTPADYAEKRGLYDVAELLRSKVSSHEQPFPVPLKTYDESLDFLRTSLESAKLGDKEKLDGFRRLDRFVRAIETQFKPEADFDAVIHHENAISPSLDGRSVFDDKPRQRSLF